jgi:transposase
MNTKLHAICDSQGRPLNLFVTAGQVSDYIGARALLSSLPDVDWLLGDRGYDADWFREALKDKGIRACIPGGKQRKKPVKWRAPIGWSGLIVSAWWASGPLARCFWAQADGSPMSYAA